MVTKSVKLPFPQNVSQTEAKERSHFPSPANHSDHSSQNYSKAIDLGPLDSSSNSTLPTSPHSHIEQSDTGSEVSAATADQSNGQRSFSSA